MDLEEALMAANRDDSIHGIMIYYPCFGNAPSFYGGNMDDYLRDTVPVEKDVEGLCYTYRHNLYHNIRYIDTQVTICCALIASSPAPSPSPSPSPSALADSTC
eukprot:228709-Hanusia_phi.AAC.3